MSVRRCPSFSLIARQLPSSLGSVSSGNGQFDSFAASALFFQSTTRRIPPEMPKRTQDTAAHRAGELVSVANHRLAAVARGCLETAGFATRAFFTKVPFISVRVLHGFRSGSANPTFGQSLFFNRFAGYDTTLDFCVHALWALRVEIAPTGKWVWVLDRPSKYSPPPYIRGGSDGLILSMTVRVQFGQHAARAMVTIFNKRTPAVRALVFRAIAAGRFGRRISPRAGDTRRSWER